MVEDKKVDIIKGAILLEHRGKALYESVVQTTGNEAVKQLFKFLVGEEKKHITLLNKQYESLVKGGAFDLSGEKPGDSPAANQVLTKDIVSGISGAGYESAVIAAALDFEKKAVQFYSEQAESTGSEEEKKLYNWFNRWETEHMKMLAKLDNEIKEQVWYDNSFWPLG